MFFIMLLSGLLSTMNILVDKVDDIRFSINDIYMTLLMMDVFIYGVDLSRNKCIFYRFIIDNI